MSTPRPRSSKAEARTQAQRERILQAAQQCFIEHGFHAAGMAKIAETAAAGRASATTAAGAPRRTPARCGTGRRRKC